MVADHLIGLLKFHGRLCFFEQDGGWGSEEAHEGVTVLGRELELDEDLVGRDVAFGVLHKQVAEAIKDLGDPHLSEGGPEEVVHLCDRSRH